MKNNTNIGEKIRFWRTTKQLSQETLASSAGISTNYLGSLERNLKSPTISVLGRICDALDISLSDFFLEEESVSTLTQRLNLETQNLSSKELDALIQIVEIFKSLNNNKT